MKIYIELTGISASVIVLISFLAKGEKNIRLINIVGALIFVAYGMLINAFSVWFLNLVLCIIHIYKILKLK